MNAVSPFIEHLRSLNDQKAKSFFAPNLARLNGEIQSSLVRSMQIGNLESMCIEVFSSDIKCLLFVLSVKLET